MPVSIMLQADGTPFIVSRYADEIWDFYPYIPQDTLSHAQKKLPWSIQLPKGLRLTDPQHTDLLESSKDFIWSLFANPAEGRKRLKMLTLLAKFRDLIPLLRWMVAMGIHRFADLGGRTLDYVPIASVDEQGNRRKEWEVVKRLVILEDLHRQNGSLGDGLRQPPWPHESACSLAGFTQNAASRQPKTAFIPDAVAARLAEVALDYVQQRSTQILAASEAVQVAAARKIASGRSSTTVYVASRVAAQSGGFDTIDDLTLECLRLRTACYIVINLFSGIRGSEMGSLAENCVVPGKSRDGSIDVLWLHGTIYKTGMRAKKWLVPPIVKEAVDVLTRLTAPLRERLRQEEHEIEERMSRSMTKDMAKFVKHLAMVRKHKDKLLLAKHVTRESTAVLSTVAANVALKRFCADFGILGDDGRPYRLHGHQFRRTYARFIARSELGDLLMLRDHFGHWSIDMTLCYADGGADEYEGDQELLDMIVDEKSQRQTEIMSAYLDSDTPLANGDHWLKTWRSSVRTAANKAELIREYAGTITLNGTGHSWCVGNARGTGCGGLCVFEAQMCVDCSYGIIGLEHRPVWEGIREQQMEALALDDMGPGGRARALQLLAYAERVISRLEGREVV